MKKDRKGKTYALPVYIFLIQTFKNVHIVIYSGILFHDRRLRCVYYKAVTSNDRIL